MELKHIETKQDYKEYQKRVSEFFENEGLKMLNNGTVYCYCGAPINFDIDPWQCSECGTDYEVINEPSFSSSPCECCNRPLGGDRVKAMGITEDDKMYEYSICVDCQYYIEYGRLDDTTMMDIEK